ncbi:MAG: pyruvate kinase [Planctomycetota bacterium]|nr:pyruvate kinase [Planctomycetota bacterium]MDA0934388.1 pyruvate kinase [Planctomycetota bacterium]
MLRPKRTKIVATLGPASRSPRSIEDLIRAGVDVFRINAAHATHDVMREDIRRIRKVAARLKAGVGILVDLQGPKIRVGSFRHAEPIFLVRGQRLLIDCTPGVIGEAAQDGEVTRIGTRYEGLAGDVRPGERILLDDGMIELKVLEVDGTEILTRVVHGGLLKQHKGINLPGSAVSMSALSDKDRGDLEVAVEEGADYVALSFVRKPDEVVELKGLIAKRGSDIRVIAKIERPEAVARLDAILAVSDALMIARGDMGVELGPEVVPAIQKRIIRASIEARKPVITATQMLESMITNPRPTRAEASDVANAIYDGTSAVMLSAETASGKYPIRAVRIMSRIIRRSEVDMYAEWEFSRRRRRGAKGVPVTQATVRAAAYAALLTDAKLIAVYTESGSTAQLLAGERTVTHAYAFTPSERTVQRLALVWGVTAVKLTRTQSVRSMVNEGERRLVQRGIVADGDVYVVIVGTSRRPGMANIMKFRMVGDQEEAAADRGE